METTGQSSLFELALDQESIGHLNETARWGKFLAIVGFVMCGLVVVGILVVGLLVMTNVVASAPAKRHVQDFDLSAAEGVGVFFVAAIYFVVFGALYFFPCVFLYNFSRRMGVALKTNDQVKLNQSLKAQKFLFRYVGILTIIAIGMEALSLVVFGIMALVVGVSR